MINLLATLIITAGVYMPIGDTGCSIYNHHPKPNDSVSVKGTCVDGLLEGKAEVVWNGRTKHIGEYVKGKKHGLGKCWYYDNTICEGKWKDNELEYGVCEWDGVKYIGRWVRRHLHGRAAVIKNGKRMRVVYNMGKLVRVYR